MLPLLSVVGDSARRAELREVAFSAQTSLIAARGLLMEAQILEILSELIQVSTRPVVPISHIAASLTKRYGIEYERPITNRWIGSVIRKKLNLQPYKSHGVYVVPTTDQQKIELLCMRYGVNVVGEIAKHSGSGDVGALGTL
jgi:hypothetical protein